MMSDQKCVVEGCNLEYDVVCSFSFYNVNTSAQADDKRQDWIEGAMHEESECLWRHVSLQLCGYHFELDAQGLWIDSPMLPELLTPPSKQPAALQQTEQDKKRAAQRSFQRNFEKFISFKDQVADIIRTEHNYSFEPVKETHEAVSRLNVRQLVDTLGYLSLKNLQKKQLWVVKVETDKAEASITQSEQVITKMTDPKQIIEIVPQTSTSEQVEGEQQNEVLHIMEDGSIADNFIYEIAEEQEITMEEVKEIPAENRSWTVNIIPEEAKPKYAYIKHCNTGKKKRHFTSEMNAITLQGDFENYYILPDVDPSVGVEITTSYEGENYIVEEYPHLVLEERPRKRGRESDPTKRRKKKNQASGSVREQVKALKTSIKTEIDTSEDWLIDSGVYEQPADDDYDDKKATRVRRRNDKYLGLDFVT
ncbi:uncharacterized protein LOC123879577 isoform X2 [Maniola jurtina]|uniref:uncharacterized protein LOC123879577 isoform X2 n=1 Tax=Maniola jurtina TaxID=191418 RepID=UPI001E6872F2|nr:uncharacterized protein LOC123879577 isoform X2 [Maniola jurtina]XP_045783324.1 uncharacterized protein LOC123879577 isoform X2 [Maniola jurtina]